ncbi:MAG: glycoside hydrolase family 15 protein, partial [Syntrophomonadaceae bacterium]
MGYQPIENYGIIGDLNTIALVGINGSIDFMCFPDFDSPSVFAAMLDDNHGGSFSISPQLDDVKNKQLYIPDTNVLLTRFLSEEGVGEITDFMPVEELYKGHILIRRVTAVRGELSFRMMCSPRFNYARSEHTAELSNNVILFRSRGEDKTALRLLSTIPIKIQNGDGYAEFKLKTGESADFILQFVKKNAVEIGDIKQFITSNLYETMNYWKDWIAESRYTGRWQEMVNRSTLVLKLMTSCRYGSLVASPTFSLPEYIGGDRNWDYRYTWIRDASFTIYSLINLGYIKEAGAFMKWVEKECQD